MIKRTISLFLLVVMLVGTGTVSWAAEDNTIEQKEIDSLDEMIAYAWEHNEDLQKLDSDIQKKEINLRDAKKAKENAIKISKGPTVRIGPAQSIESQASMGLIRKGYNLIRVQNEYDILLEQKEQTKQSISVNITKSYIAVIQSQNNRAYMEKMLEKLNKLLGITELRYKLNMATELELNSLKNQLERLNNQLVELEERENNMIKDLKRLINLPDDYNLVFTDDFAMDEKENLNADVIIQRALENRLDLKQMKNAEDLQKLKVDVYGSYYSKASSTYKLEVMALETMQKDIQTKIKDIQDNLLVSIRNLELLREAYILSDSVYQSAMNKYEVDKLKYSLGMISSIDMMDSELELMDASNNKKNALFNYISAKLDLDLNSTYGASVGAMDFMGMDSAILSGMMGGLY